MKVLLKKMSAKEGAVIHFDAEAEQSPGGVLRELPHPKLGPVTTRILRR